ncbi:GDSL esterase/lipase At1g29660-like [Zingiber officinale]|uniref:GDSL esterase/lipase n=1 Tax=Zingiber officinale TaxID=94328 RepID=A0A8J5KVN8_ZINOF|nr:GDSL esterase/lipase At1g29660-like [Zingiber officinale]KAG6491358.1 hypothetical protein ZIOFF_052698 [Zingiber officinale]
MSRLFFILLFVAFTSLLLPQCHCINGGGNHSGEVRGMFVFGSSLVDNGNNNFLHRSAVRADYAPYGIDFPGGPSGRFSNGRNAVDVLSQLLRLPSLIPPYADPHTRGERIVCGVNFASGGSGILDQTGSTTGEVMSMRMQIKAFEQKTLVELKSLPGFSNHHLAEYLFVVGTGGNDYLLNYFARAENLNNSTARSNFTRLLISTLSAQLKRLYDLGARKFVLFSVQAMGCVPVVRAIHDAHTGSGGGGGACVEAVNKAADLFNCHLRRLAKRKHSMPGSSIVYVNSYKIIRDIIGNPTGTGFHETSRACCELSSAMEEGRGVLCKRGGRACSHRSSHVFFDGLHPTDAVNERIAREAYGSYRKAVAYPINVQQLAKLSI